MGRDRRDYLYNMEFWEILLIIRGYRRRNVLMYQLQRQQVFASATCMGNPNNLKPKDIIPLYCDNYKETDEHTITDAERSELQNLINTAPPI